MAEFKEGDCVQIKHGETPDVMTINSIKTIPITGKIEIWCKWFNTDTQEFQNECFSPEALKHCEQSVIK